MVSSNTRTPFWDPPTANSKLDYLVTRYIAEFINSLSNSVYVIYALYGLCQLYKERKLAAAHVVPYLGLLAVGVFSAAFHATPKYHTQMALILCILLINIAAYHIVTDELIVHQVFFGVSVTIIGIRTMQLIHRRTIQGSVARAQIWGMARFGALIFHIGYWLWLIDNWWHICTGIGAYIFIAVIDHLLSSNDHNEIPMGPFAWPAPWASRSVFAEKTATVRAEKEE
ncbi:ceramidase-domain-containing protein [Aspergillus multicolor]|uniref:ceramidase n=1 Tax=Aspergillus multicolor TaxID=41759 RepID=UPI003CCD69CF